MLPRRCESWPPRRKVAPDEKDDDQDGSGTSTSSSSSSDGAATASGISSTSYTSVWPSGTSTPFANEDSWERILKHNDFRVIDRLKVPRDIAPGKYVLSWRHDSEQTPQVWANCADLNIV